MYRPKSSGFLHVALVIWLLGTSQCAPLKDSQAIQFQVHVKMENRTCVLAFPPQLSSNSSEVVDDGQGAMYFAVAVISMYGLSIALMIGSTLKRNQTDYEVKGFLRSFAKLDAYRRQTEKHRMKQVLGRLHSTLRTGARMGRDRTRGTSKGHRRRRRRSWDALATDRMVGIGLQATRALPTRAVLSSIEEIDTTAMTKFWTTYINWLMLYRDSALQWRYNEHDGVSNHQPNDCLLNRSLKAQIKENTKAPRHWPLWG